MIHAHHPRLCAQIQKDITVITRRLSNSFLVFITRYLYVYVYIYTRNEVTENFSETSSFRRKSSWKPPQRNASFELFLSEIERELFEIPSFLKEEWEYMGSLANDKSIVTRKVDRGSCVVVWDREHYILEAEKHLSDKHVYRDVDLKSKILQELAETSNNIFKNLKRKGKMTKKRT